MNQKSDSPRKGPRFSAGIPAVVRQGGADFECSAHDLSRSGVLLIGDLPAPTGDPVDLTLKAPSGTLDVTLQARSVREHPSGEEGGREIAFEFLPPDAAQHEGLESLIARVLEGNAPGPLESLRPGASPPEIRKALDQVPLPHKIALAVRAGVREREYLRQDTRGAVLESLARNPSLLVAEVRALVSSPHILPTTLDFLAADARWKGDEEIQLSLLSHPKIRFPAAQKILEALPPNTLRKALHRPGVQPAIRDKVVRRLSRG
jgi:hypothetical protein